MATLNPADLKKEVNDNNQLPVVWLSHSLPRPS